MAKKQTRRSISVSRTTYERLKAFCEANNVSMSQLVETRVNDFLGGEAPGDAPAQVPVQAPRPAAPLRTLSMGGLGFGGSSSNGMTHAAPPRPMMPAPVKPPVEIKQPTTVQPAPVQQVPMTSAAARIAVEPPPPIIKPRQETAAPKPAEKRPDQIFTF